MKTALIILSCLIIIIVLIFVVFGKISKQGNTPGIVDSQLSPCSNSPNCVCSEYREDIQHYLSPIPLAQLSESEALAVLKDVIQAMGGTILIEENGYIAAVFSSSFFGFIDDLEIRSDSSTNLIHIRSASRIGYSDLGINQKRVELLKQLYQEKIGEN